VTISNYGLFFIILLYFLVLGMELRVSRVLSSCSATELQPQRAVLSTDICLLK
jgi:hypothetical protein